MKTKSKTLSLRRVKMIATDIRSFGLPHDLENEISLRDAVDVLQKCNNAHPELATISAALEIARAAFEKEKRSEEDGQSPRATLQDAPEHVVNKPVRSFSAGHQ
jgi:hypothetical protein